MHLPIVISSPQAIDILAEWQYGIILDASREGIRIWVENDEPMTVGSIVQIVCQTAENRRPKNTGVPVSLKGKVVWHNADTKQFALQYVN